MQQENATHTRDEKGRFMTGNDFARKTEKTAKTKTKPSAKESILHLLFELNVPTSIAQPFRKIYSRKPKNYMDMIHGVLLKESFLGNLKATRLLLRGIELFEMEVDHKVTPTKERKQLTVNVLLTRPAPSDKCSETQPDSDI